MLKSMIPNNFVTKRKKNNATDNRHKTIKIPNVKFVTIEHQDVENVFLIHKKIHIKKRRNEKNETIVISKIFGKYLCDDCLCYVVCK